MTKLDKLIITLCAIVALLCCAGIARGEDRPLYWSSVATLTAAHVADARSSWGKMETNPLMRSADGRLGAKGVAVKSSIVVGSFVVQTVLIRKYPRFRRAASILNFALAGVMAGVVLHNVKQ